jgi:roadblock/LC7 domain-containing protein
VSLPVFSPDSKRVAYQALKVRNVHVVVDGTESEAWEGIGAGPMFSSDGRHVAYTAERGRKSVVVVDGAASAQQYDSLIASQQMFDTPTSLHLMGVRAEEFFLLEVTASSP